MTHEIRMPRLTDDMEQGTVIRWLIEAGQPVSAGDPIAEVETDKADVEIEADRDGVVQEIVVGAGDSASVGAVLALLGEPGSAAKKAPGADRAAKSAVNDEDGGARRRSPDGGADGGEKSRADEPEDRRDDGRAPAARAKTTPAARTRPPADAIAPPRRGAVSGQAASVSPLARELAAQHAIDLAGVSGSGPGGRIVKRDVENALAHSAPETPAESSGESGAAPTVDRSDGVAAATGEMSRMRRTIAGRMAQAKREIPHFYLRSEVDFAEVMRLRDAIRDAELIPGLTVTHILLRALAVTLPRHQRLNASWREDAVAMAADVNIGIAVALPDGLLVPVIKRAQTLALAQIAAAARALTERARANKLHSDDLVGATISVSNIGMLDVDELTPIINAPQAAIVGVGAVRERPVVRAGALAVGRTAMLTLACDHRIVNGIEAGEFLADLKRVLENPIALVVEEA